VAKSCDPANELQRIVSWAGNIVGADILAFRRSCTMNSQVELRTDNETPSSLSVHQVHDEGHSGAGLSPHGLSFPIQTSSKDHMLGFPAVQLLSRLYSLPLDFFYRSSPTCAKVDIFAPRRANLNSKGSGMRNAKCVRMRKRERAEVNF